MSWAIDPKKSGWDNLWDCATYNTRWFSRRSAGRGLQLSKDEWDEVQDIIIMTSVRRFMNKLMSGKYNREYSFFLNVRASVWECFYKKIEQYLRTVVHPKMTSYDRHEAEKRAYILDHARVLRYVADESEAKNAMASLRVWMRSPDNMHHVNHERVMEFWDYCESCMENNIQVNKNSMAYLLGCRQAIGERRKVEMILIRDNIIGDAVLGSLLVGGQKICDTLENKKYLLPYGDYKLNVSKSPTFGRELPLIFNDKVKMQRGFRIHAGNTAKDSRGCLLVGFGRVNDTITDSRKAESAVTEISRHDCTLKIVSNGMI
jgi:hypothetical protein